MPPKRLPFAPIDPLVQSSKKLISLLPKTDQNNDTLLDALKQNNIFWEHLVDWQVLLAHKEFEKKRFDWNITELSGLSWKDENFENYWGERLEKGKGKGKEKEKGKKRGRKPIKQESNKKVKPAANDQTDIRKSRRKIAPSYTNYEDE
ncbi:unnamed protein product [Cunninghamella echinulata]